MPFQATFLFHIERKQRDEHSLGQDLQGKGLEGFGLLPGGVRKPPVQAAAQSRSTAWMPQPMRVFGSLR